MIRTRTLSLLFAGVLAAWAGPLAVPAGAPSIAPPAPPAAAADAPVWDSFLIGPATVLDDGGLLACGDARSQLTDGPLGNATCTLEGRSGPRHVLAMKMSLQQVAEAWVGTGYKAVGMRALFSGHGQVRDDQIVLYVKEKG